MQGIASFIYDSGFFFSFINRLPTQDVNRSDAKKANVRAFLSSQFVYAVVEVLRLWAGRKKWATC